MGLIYLTQPKRDLVTWKILNEVCRNEMMENTEETVKDRGHSGKASCLNGALNIEKRNNGPETG